MSGRSQALVAILLAGLVAGGGAALDRNVGVREEPVLPRSSQTSGAWFCPHGGGPRGWAVTLEVANPGEVPSTVRVTPLGSARPGAGKTYDVGAGTTVAVPTSGEGRAASSLVEYFGGWVAVGWVARAGGHETGVAAEPCTERAGTRWFAADGSTASAGHQETYLLVMNPFATQAVFDVVLFRKGLAPVRSTDLKEIRLAPGRSVSIGLKQQAFNEDPVGAEVDVSSGRVAVASLGVGGLGGIRSAIGYAGSPTARTYVPIAGAGAQSTVVVTVPGTASVQLSATLVSSRGSQPAGTLTGRAQPPQSASGYPVLTDGPSSVDLVATGAGAVAAGRVVGRGGDLGSTGGVGAPAARWLVTPTVGCRTSVPGLVVANPGPTPVDVTLHSLPDGDRKAAPDAIVRVPAGAAVSAPNSFLMADPTAAVLVTATGGTVVAGGASSSCGKQGTSAFALAAGIPVPVGV